MADWAGFAAASPAIAPDGLRLFYRTEIGEGLLATVRGFDPPRIHPIYLAVHDGRLLAFLRRSPKVTDLVEDGRYALHAHQNPAAPHEFMVRGRALLIDDEATRSEYAAGWYFAIEPEHFLFELFIEHAVFGERATADDWPPVYRSWHEAPD